MQPEINVSIVGYIEDNVKVLNSNDGSLFEILVYRCDY